MIKVLKSHLNSVAFSTESLDLYPLPGRIADSLSSDEMLTYEDLKEKVEDEHINDQVRITGLVLLIAQTCNLKCSYCFAEAYMGSNSRNRVMSPATAGVAIDKVLKNMLDVTRIQFFGGEPLIGLDTIKETVQACEKYCVAHQTRMPAFGITTNGTLINREVIELFRAHNFSVTISLDGPQHINDKQRQFPSGKGTYGMVEEKIRLLRDSGMEIGIEAVFTDNHRNFRETIESTYEFLLKLGAREIYLTPAIGGSPDESLDGNLLADLEHNYTASTEKIMDTWLTNHPIRMGYCLDVLHTLTSRKGKTHFCGAGFNVITVDSAGKVFPCYNLISDSLCMGSVYDRVFPGKDFRNVTALMRQTSKDCFSKCASCWVKKLCSSCYGDTFAAHRTLGAPRESICVIIRSVIRAILLKFAEFMTDEEKWKSFTENINRSDLRFDIDCKDGIL